MVSGFMEWAGSIVSKWRESGRSDVRRAHYYRMLQAYNGYQTRQVDNATRPTYKKVKFNFCRPIVNISAAWVAGKPVSWRVEPPGGSQDRYDELSQAASDVWDRSGSEDVLLKAVMGGCIFGDMVGVVRSKSGSKDYYMQFMDPSICEPLFDPHDCHRLVGMTVRYEIEVNGKGVDYVEVWSNEGVDVFIDKVAQPTMGEDFSALKDTGIRAFHWIKNESIPGQSFGASDISEVLESTMEYDHLASGMSRVVDYYSRPRIVIKGVAKKDLDMAPNAVWFLPANAEAKFLIWDKPAPAFDKILDRIREAISEISEVPAIAFGQVDSGFSGASGVSMKVLYGPLELKTRRKKANWGPVLEELMAACLVLNGTKVDLQDVDVMFQTMLPSSDLEEVQTLTYKAEMGVSNKQLQRELGYDAATIKTMEKEVEEQVDADLEKTAKAFSSTPVSGNRGNPAPSMNTDRSDKD